MTTAAVPGTLADAYLIASAVPVRTSHSSDTLAEARALLAEHPSLPQQNIFTAAVSGDVDAVRALLADEPLAGDDHRRPPRLGRPHLVLLLAMAAR
ncbi:MAG: hypothetical protein HEQ38_12790 [Gemmatimonas sp.]|nr:hypothetical protein [Gemmatimonas sp.]